MSKIYNLKTLLENTIWVTLFIVAGSLIGLSIYSVNAFIKSDVIASNVTYNGVYIGDLKKEDALTLLKSKTFNADLPVKVNYNDKSFEFAPNASGINYNLDAVVHYAYNKGIRANLELNAMATDSLYKD